MRIVDRLLIGVGLLTITAVGNFIIRRKLKLLLERKDRAIEFHNKLGEYLQSHGRDSTTYTWLVHRSVRMQTEMEGHGIMARFRPPFANYMVSNWAIVLNALPEIQQALKDQFLFNQAADYAQLVKDALVRYVGDLDDDLEMIVKERRNPISSFREGIQAVLRTPAFVLHWLGLRSAPGLSTGRLGRMLSGIAALLTLLSAVVTLVVGWQPFIAFLHSIHIFRR